MKWREYLGLITTMSFVSLIISECLFYLNFTPFSLTHLTFFGDLPMWLRWLCGWLLSFFSLILISGITILCPSLIADLKRQWIVCFVLFWLFNLALNFDHTLFPKMNFLAEVALLTWILFVFYTTFYSILYRHLLK